MLVAHAQDSSKISVSSFRINMYAALVLNNSFSNIPSKTEYPGENSVINRSKSGISPAVYSGFLVGLEGLMFRSEKFRGVLGLALSHSKAAHHFSYMSEDPSFQSSYAKIRRNTETDITQSLWMAHISAGVRRHIVAGLFAKAMLVFDKPFSTSEEVIGYTETTYIDAANNPAESKRVTEDRAMQKVSPAAANLSFRLEAEYQARVMDTLVRGFVFRNFGMISTQPWWGIGIGMTLQE
jgi:hypothetical protein